MSRYANNESSKITYNRALSHVMSTLTGSSSAQMSNAVGHFLASVGKNLESPIGPELLDQFEQSKRLLYKHIKDGGLSDSTYSSLVSRISTLRETALKLIADLSLPPEFHLALGSLIVRSGYSYEDLNVRFGDIVSKWRLGHIFPKERSIPKLRAIEEYLKVPGALLSRLPHLIGHINVVHEIDPSDGLPADFGKCLRALRHSKELDLIELVKMVNGRGESIARGSLSRWEIGTASPLKVQRRVIVAIEAVLGVSGPLLKRYDAIAASIDPCSPVLLVKKPYGYWNESIEKEFEHLAWFKSTPDLPPGLKRNKQGVWNRDASKQMWALTLRLFVGYCQQSASHPDPMLRGAGIPEADLSLALFLDCSLVKAFCDFRRGRNALKSYNSATVSFIAGLRNLVHPDTGYFTQHPELYCRHPRLQHLLPSSIEVMVLHSKETRMLTRPRDRFIALCGQVFTYVDDFLQKLTHGGEAKQTRDPTRRGKKILADPQPLEAFLKLRERMEKVIPSTFTKTKLASHLTNLALVALMNIKPLRCRTLTELRETEIYRTPDGRWCANVPKERFKNARFAARDGWVGEIHDSAWPALDRYWNEARPHLMLGSTCGRFWVNTHGGLLSEAAIHNRFLDFTKQFIPDYAPDGINPHLWRTVVAHDNFKTNRENAVTLSAQQLIDMPKTVVKSYAKDNDPLRNEWANKQTDARMKSRKQS